MIITIKLYAYIDIFTIAKLSLQILLNGKTLRNANCINFTLIFQEGSCLLVCLIDAG